MVYLKKAKQIYLIILIGLALSGCDNKKNIDVSNIKLNVKIDRFDKDFDSLNKKPILAQATLLKNKYGVFYGDFLKTILEESRINTEDTSYFGLIKQVLAGQPYQDLKHDVDSIFPDISAQEASLTEAFKRVKYYFPNKNLPKVYTSFSGFHTQIAVGDHYIAIGLDMFLGANSRFYPSLTKLYPRYISRNFRPDNIVPSVINGLAREDMFPESDSSKTLLSKMIYNGKILYFMDQILPEVPDSTKIGYTNAQLNWCNQFKATIWGYFLDENLLYESDFNKIQKYLGPAPFTTGLGENNESSPQLGVWTGWQIVKAYMEKNPHITLSELMYDQDAQKILNDSRYRPK